MVSPLGAIRMTKITFHGAARTVTGSKYLLETPHSRVLVDCGLFQGQKELRERNWAPPPFDSKSVDAVVLTHAHLDHSGYLPKLVEMGYKGPIYATAASRQLSELILADSAVNQERDAEYYNRKGISKHHPAKPLYTRRDTERAMKQFDDVPRGEWKKAAPDVRFRFHDAGHLLGSCSIELEVDDGGKPTRILFSGDVGRCGAPLYHDPPSPVDCDVLVCESTYGNRDHPSGDILDQLASVVLRSVERGGVMLTASFAIGRAQQLIYLLQVLMRAGRIPEMPIYLDSPMAVDATGVFREHYEDHDLEEGQLSEQQLLDGRHVHLARSVDDSKAINSVQGPAVIISSSGMMEGGRILFHLKRRLPDRRNTIVLGGFMAYGTRGRALQHGADALRIHGREIPVNAAVESLSGLSGHADRGELLSWLREMKHPPKSVFLTHGELDAAEAFRDLLYDGLGVRATIPHMHESIEL